MELHLTGWMVAVLDCSTKHQLVRREKSDPSELFDMCHSAAIPHQDKGIGAMRSEQVVVGNSERNIRNILSSRKPFPNANLDVRIASQVYPACVHLSF